MILFPQLARSRALVISGCMLASLFMPATAYSSVINYNISGTIVELIGVDRPIPGIDVGTPWSVNMTYSGDGAADDSDGFTSTYSLENYSLSVGTVVSVNVLPFVIGNSEQSTDLTVGDTGPSGDYLEFHASRFLSGGGGSAQAIEPSVIVNNMALWRSFVVLSDSSNSLWSSNDLLNSVIHDLNDFDDNRFVLTFDDLTASNFSSYLGSVDSYSVTVVPLPPAVFLFASGVLVMLFGAHGARKNALSVLR